MKKLYLVDFGSGPEGMIVRLAYGEPERLQFFGDFYMPEELFLQLRGTHTIEVLEDGLLPETVETGITCRSRMSQPGPWEMKEGLDSWVKRGADRTCSFCGSIHPDDLIKLLDEGIGVSRATGKDYKLYIDHRPHVPNSGFGAGKFYAWHLNEALTERLNK